MTPTVLSSEAKNVIILAGNVLERSIEAKCLEIARQRNRDAASEHDAKAAIDKVFTEGIDDLSRLIKNRLAEYEQRQMKAA